jgi:S-DNA-T family DNA segregation ATPase FtsK/SpoIIIE
MMDQPSRRRFGAVAALVLGAFLGLALLPLDVTGPLGTAIGPALWRALGLGAIGAPLLGVLIGLAGFDRLPRLDMKRAAILTLGGMLLVPYGVGVIARVNQSVFLADISLWGWPARLTGWLPGLLATAALDSIGVAGALLAGFVALTAVTLGTLAWHPLQRLERGTAAVTDGVVVPIHQPIIANVAGDAALEPSEEDAEAGESLTRRPAKSARRAAKPVIGRSLEEALPPLDLLDPPRTGNVDADQAELQRLGQLLLDTLRTFKVECTLAGITSGPTVSQFEVVPASGVKAGRIVALAEDLAITMRAASLRVAPIPGRGAVGVEIANPSPRMVTLREMLASDEFQESTAVLPMALGRDVEGRPVVADLARMPHLLVAGATGSGKSIAINTIITALIYKYTASELRLLMIDPKMVELSMYNDLPHLRQKVVTDNNDAAKVLKWAVFEMNRRYALLNANSARNLAEFNLKVREGKPLRNPPGARPTLSTIAREDPDTPPEPAWQETYREGQLPMIVLFVDELADLMMTVQAEVETPLAMLAQKARAIGIHLILSTQRPSVNVLTGLIKANFPSRIAFRVASKVDSRTILDQNGAEALLGNGDMLFMPPGRNEPMRVQGAFISTDETERVMKWYAQRREAPAHTVASEADILEIMRAQEDAEAGGGVGGSAGERDALFRQAAETCIQHQGGSTSLLQRRLGIGYGRAARIIDQLHDAGILGPPNGSKPRDVLIGLYQVEEYTA